MYINNVLEVDGHSINLNLASTEENVLKMENALNGKLLGKWLPYFFLLNNLRKMWGYVGNFKLIMISVDFFICNFENEGDRDTILMSGPWFLAGGVIALNKWSPHIDLDALDGLSSPLWVRLPKIPIMYSDNTNITSITSLLGEPLWLDHQINE